MGPGLRDCNLSILGQMVLASAHEFDAHGQTVSDAGLEKGESRPRDYVRGGPGKARLAQGIGQIASEQALLSAVVASTARVLRRCSPQSEQALQAASRYRR